MSEDSLEHTREFIVRHAAIHSWAHPLAIRSGARPDEPIRPDWIAVTEVTAQGQEPHSWPMYFLTNDGEVLASFQWETLEVAMDQAHAIAGIPRATWCECRVAVPKSGRIPRTLCDPSWRMVTNPTPMTRADCNALASLKGARLSGVTYHHLFRYDESGDPLRGYAGGEKGVDSYLAAVDLHFNERRTTAITWAMDGWFQGLGALSGESYSGIATDHSDAAGREAWHEHIGDTIRSVAASWHSSHEDFPESIWAVRFDFSRGSVVIALGSTWHASPAIEYMPDEIVVVFDPSLARSYKPPAVNESSWGSSIEPT
jgi:hypothetical protein